MKEIFLFAALVLIGMVVAGLIRISRGPTAADRMLAMQLFGTTGVAILLLLSVALDLPHALDAALFLALLGVVVGVAFTTHGWASKQDGNEPPHEPH